MSDDLVNELLNLGPDDSGFREVGVAAAQALTEARAEIERLRAELDASNANHRQMATTMADLARKHDALRARVREVVGPFAMNPLKLDDDAMWTFYTTVGQVRAARQLMENLKDA